MTKRYTREDYSPDVLPGGLHRDCVDVITGAVALGWAVEVRHIRAILRAPAPNESKSIPFSASAPPTNLNGIKRKIKKYGTAAPKKKQADHAAKAEAEAAANAELERVAAEKREAALRKEAEVKGEVKLAGERAVENKKPDPNPTIIRSEPLMVKQSGHGRAVASQTTIERTWSDGRKDYACNVPGCDFVSDNKYGPGRGHRKAHVLRGEAPVTNKWSKNYQPEQEEVVITVRNEQSEALASALKTAVEEGVDWSNLDAAVKALAERATALLPKPSEPDTPEPDTSEPEPPSEAEVTLQKIADLIGGATAAQHRDEIAALRSKVAEVRAELAEVTNERDRLGSERSALRDLLTDEKKEAAS